MMTEDKFHVLERAASGIVRWASGSLALVVVFVLLVGWISFGPIFGFSTQWQSTMLTPSAAITFLLVFLILRAQSKDTRAIQMKLNEIIASQNGANNQLIDIENMSEHALSELHKRYEAVAIHMHRQNAESEVTEVIIPHELAEEIVRAEAIERNSISDECAKAEALSKADQS